MKWLQCHAFVVIYKEWLTSTALYPQSISLVPQLFLMSAPTVPERCRSAPNGRLPQQDTIPPENFLGLSSCSKHVHFQFFSAGDLLILNGYTRDGVRRRWSGYNIWVAVCSV
jgi:hypothetical protein